ncbi:TPA: hypothetical protein N0F65_000507 [Lagenidium giganteum]|uniref:Mitochondrial carrier protein n=1 Tax=Lagenidium giganteum TaxID=4803 RepID=A0AAV2YVP1_9STRA|nr:TPA: hypothetical protein N0F65_000507 [Lagenidium giganteum]
MASEIEHLAHQNEYSVVVDFASGVVGGCSGIFVGQPFDTVKVRLQTHSSFYKGPIDCARQTLQHEGVRGFFKGLASPLFGSAWTNAIMFATYERALKVIDDTPQNPTLTSVFLAGSIGGFFQTIAVTPTDLIKCRLQVQDGHESSRYRGPMDCVKHVYQRNGIRGLFQGYVSTVYREVPSFGYYFLSYEYFKRKMIDHDVSAHTAMLMAGGLAGVGSWAISYPMDVIKSSIQTLPLDAQAHEKTIMYQARRLYGIGGARIFVNGLETAIVRAFPVNAVTFFFYEKTSEMLKDLTKKHKPINMEQESAGFGELVERHRLRRSANLEHDIPFLWRRSLVFVFSYALLLSDVIRSGLGIRSFAYAARVEPEVFVYFGPYNYTGTKIVASDLNHTGTVWSYKYDSTSMGMRGFAEFFNASWSSCLFYKSTCESDTIPFSVISQMLESLVERVVNHSTYAINAKEVRHQRPVSTSLLTYCVWLDRFHHYLLPEVFLSPRRRLNQALHYDEAMLKKFPDLCYSAARAKNTPRPYFCDELWSNYRRSCNPAKPKCVAVGTIQRHMQQRMQWHRLKFPNSSFNLTIIESMEAITKSGVAMAGRKSFDVISIIRARTCDDSGGSCSTVMIEDYRYEGVWVASDAPTWFPLVATLRIMGQVYVWCRLLMLVSTCWYYCTHSTIRRNRSILSCIVVTTRLLFQIPSQNVIYGSFFPTFCYVLSHAVDSSMAYELVAENFTTLNGLLQLKMTTFLQLSAVQMRNVWVLSLAAYVFVLIQTHRGHWTHSAGILGLRGYAISLVASLSLLTHYRALVFRDSRVLHMEEVVSGRPLQIKTHLFRSLSHPEMVIFGADMIDLKCILCTLMCIAGVTLFSRIIELVGLLWTRQSIKSLPEDGFFLKTTTFVPYSVGPIIPTTAFTVNWHMTAFMRTMSWLDHLEQRLGMNRQIRRIRPANRLFLRTAGNGADLVAKSSIRRSIAGRQLDRHNRLLCVDQRNQQVQSTICLVNLAFLCDPWTFYRIYYGGEGILVAFYKSKRNGRLVLLPQGLASSASDVDIIWNDFEKLLTVKAAQLSLIDLVYCG